MAKDGGAADPLRNPRFQEPSVWQLFRESLFGKPRLLDCIQVEVTSVCPANHYKPNIYTSIKIQ